MGYALDTIRTPKMGGSYRDVRMSEIVKPVRVNHVNQVLTKMTARDGFINTV